MYLPVLSRAKTETELQKEYVEFLNADSNKIIIGLRYVLDEYYTGGDVTHSTYCEFINPEYKSLFIDYELISYADGMYHGFTEKNVWDWHIKELKAGLEYANGETYRNHVDSLSYVRCENMKTTLDPTFKGYLEWKETGNLKSITRNKYYYAR